MTDKMEITRPKDRNKEASNRNPNQKEVIFTNSTISLRPSQLKKKAP